jgi:hypothetical protein
MKVFICNTDNCENKGKAYDFKDEPESAYCTGCDTVLEPVDIIEPSLEDE